MFFENTSAYSSVTSPSIVPLEVGRRPHLAGVGIDDLDRDVVEDGVEAVALIEAERVVDRLVGRARLAARLHGAVELRAVVVVAADHRDDVAGVVIGGEDRGLRVRHLLELDHVGVRRRPTRADRRCGSHAGFLPSGRFQSR